MRSLRGFLALVAALGLLAAAAAAAAPREANDPDGSVALPRGSTVRIADGARQAELERLPAWTDFLSRHGPWSALWNDATETPHRAFGRGIPLPSFADDPQGVDRAVRRFVAEHSTLFGAPTLATVAVDRAGGRWYVRYRQIVNGVPVLFSDWEFRVGLNGKLFAFGADLERPAGPVETAARLVGAAAREAAKQGLSFDPATDRVEGGEQLYLVPLATGPAAGGRPGTELRLAYDVRIHTSDPPGNWFTLVDARTGEVLYRQNHVLYEILGSSSGTVHTTQPYDPLASRPFRHLLVVAGSDSAFTDSSGAFIAPPSGAVPLSAQLYGLYCDVDRYDARDASFSTTATDTAAVDIAWGSANSHVAERDGYYHVNVVHDYIKRLDPDLPVMDYSMPCLVNLRGQTCNAFWNGAGVNFFAAGGGCVNAATVPDVTYHEYGHGVNDLLYAHEGAFMGMNNLALHEGLADVNAAFLRDDPRIGVGLLGPGTYLRDVDNSARWPRDRSADPHLTGLIISGAFWSLRQAVGLSVAEHLVHFAKYGLADDTDDGVAMTEFFLETLIADDDDGDLSNGTPHGGAIIDAFNAHGIGTGYYVHIAHVPYADQTAGGSFPVRATMRYEGPFGAFDPSSPALHYSIDDAPYVTEPMTATGEPDDYGGSFAAAPGSVVRYYLTAADTYGGVGTSPTFAPQVLHVYTFLVGATIAPFFDDMEQDRGWTVGAPDDSARTGIWVREDPIGTDAAGDPIQPEDDHSPAPEDTVCWVTGNWTGLPNPGANDVDGGRTTLFTPLFSARVGVMEHPVIEYYRWFSNAYGTAAGQDFWRVYISNDGGKTWTHVENTRDSDNSWERVLFRIEDYVTPTSTMKMRFVAEDVHGELVEAAVDDFKLMGLRAAPLVQVLQPNGDELLSTGDHAGLAWSALDDFGVTGVDLLLSRTGPDGPFETIATSVPNSGPYPWLVTGPSTKDAYLKVVAHDADGNSDSDLSDGAFSIVDSVTAVMLSRFQAEPIEGGMELRWRLAEPRRFAKVVLERADEPDGPWSPVDAAVRDEDGESVAIDAGVVAERTYFYRLVATTPGGQTLLFGPLAGTAGSPIRAFALASVAPSPTAGAARIEYTVPTDSHLRLSVIDIQGREVAVLVDGPLRPGRHQAVWSGETERGPAPSGLYFVRLITPRGAFTRRLVLAR